MHIRLGESQFGKWVDREPNRAPAYLALVGPAVLLMEPLHPDLQGLREVQERAGDGDGINGTGGDSESQGSSGEDVPDSGDLEFDFDFDVLGDLGGAFDAIDTGVDAGGGDGGDGGGNGGD